MTKKKIAWDWQNILEKMEAGCTAKEIVGGICDISVFYIRFKENFGVRYVDVCKQYRYRGDGIIRHKQYQMAKNGNVRMLELLGIERLGQKRDIAPPPPNDEILALRHANMMLRDSLSKLNGGKLPENLNEDLNNVGRVDDENNAED